MQALILGNFVLVLGLGAASLMAGSPGAADVLSEVTVAALAPLEISGAADRLPALVAGLALVAVTYGFAWSAWRRRPRA